MDFLHEENYCEQMKKEVEVFLQSVREERVLETADGIKLFFAVLPCHGTARQRGDPSRLG